ncbi:MAG: hypothetical protein MRY21_02250 [Simkaniaceae bacterium]|nr:hypothetical protein [Simkaniaceae bacterium]
MEKVTDFKSVLPLLFEGGKSFLLDQKTAERVEEAATTIISKVGIGILPHVDKSYFNRQYLVKLRVGMFYRKAPYIAAAIEYLGRLDVPSLPRRRLAPLPGCDPKERK